MVDTPDPSAVGYLPNAATQQHHLGLRRTPRYRLTQPYSPDDAWAVQALSDGTDPEDPPLPSAPWADRWRAFLDEGNLTIGAGLPLLLPAGVYDVVRSVRPAVPANEVLLGNEAVRAAPNVALVSPTRPVYLCAFGPDPSAPPPTNQPLLGLTLLNHTGARDWDAVWAFALWSSPPEPSGEPVIVVPIEGPLVVDAMAFFSDANEQARSRAVWQERAEAFGASLTFDETE